MLLLQDVKAPAHLMLVKLCASSGGAAAVLSQLDKLVEPLEKTLTTKLKSDAVKQEVRGMQHPANPPVVAAVMKQIHHLQACAGSRTRHIKGKCHGQEHGHVLSVYC